MTMPLSDLRTASVVIRNLPETPGYNGSLCTIDDVEAERIAKAIDAGISTIETLRELLDLIFASTMPYNDGAPTFSDKVTDMWKELK